ncbi:hypothetical protein [Hyalangium versicolor]|uniref:hypothetical protein n=1 Tax=Hyalangium versicolor TaxID=2861190 RepID=UPI001CCDB893|nr:hypothetical protein [Hyalangium versicolor]
MKKFRDVNVKTTLTEELTLEQFHSELVRLMREENANHYGMGQLYNRAVEKKLAEAAGYKNVLDYLSKKLPDLSNTSLRRYAAVAASFDEKTAVRFGVTCLELLLTYKEVADLKIDHAEPGGTVIEVPGENGAVTPKAFSACSVDEMRRAIQRKRKPASSKPLPEEDLALANQYQEALSGQFPKGVVVKTLVRNEKGSAVLDITSIPVRQVPTLLNALAAVVPPEGEAK